MLERPHVTEQRNTGKQDDTATLPTLAFHFCDTSLHAVSVCRVVTRYRWRRWQFCAVAQASNRTASVTLWHGAADDGCGSIPQHKTGNRSAFCDAATSYRSARLRLNE